MWILGLKNFEIPEAANSSGDEMWAPELNVCIVRSNTTRENNTD